MMKSVGEIIRQHQRRLARLGGLAVAAKYPKEHYQEMQRKGVAARKKKKKLSPPAA